MNESVHPKHHLKEKVVTLGNSILTPLFNKWENDFVNFGQNRTSLELQRLSLAKTRESLRKEGHPPSRPAICVGYIKTFAEVLRETAAEKLQWGKVDLFMKDYVEGADFLCQALLAAESLIMGGLAEQLEESGEFDLEDIELTINYTDGNVKTLKDDPTGIKLMDNLFAETKEQFEDGRLSEEGEIFGDKISPYCFFRGAQFATTAYKALYPLTENLPDA